MSVRIDIHTEQQNSAMRKNLPQADALECLEIATAGGGNIQLVAIADGEGPENRFDLAKVTLRRIIDHIRASTTKNIQELLKDSILSAHNALLNDKKASALPQECFVGVTVVAIQGNKLFLAHFGHTRAYLIRRQKVTQLTEDHMLMGGVYCNAVGLEHSANPMTVFKNPEESRGEKINSLTLKTGDNIILCTDGVFGNNQEKILTSEEIRSSCEEPTARHIARRLISIPMSKNSDDNMSVIAIRIMQRMGLQRIVLYAGITVGVILLAIAILYLPKNHNKIDEETLAIVDTGVAFMESSTEPVERLRPGEDRGELVEGFQQFPAQYGLRTLKGNAEVLITGIHIYIGPNTTLFFSQIDPQEENVIAPVILTLHGGEFIVQTEQEDRSINIQTADEKKSATLGSNIPGTIGIRMGEYITIDCLEGSCFFQYEETKTPIPVMQRLIITPNNAPSFETITQVALSSWQKLCSCLP